VDVGHGSHFSFDMARRVLEAGIKPYTLGADMHGYNVKIASAEADRKENPFFGVAPFNLTNAMSKILHLGMSLTEVVATVTSNPAKMLGMADQIGTLAVGREADISVVEILDGAFELSDNSGVSVTAEKMIVPVFCLRGGEKFAASSPLVPPAMEKLAA
jgi:dihydroorotase